VFGRLLASAVIANDRPGAARKAEDDVVYGFIRATRQTWKFNLGWGGLVIGCVCLFGEVEGWWRLSSPTAEALMILGGCSLNVAAFMAMILAIRCPECGLKVFWQALRTQPIVGWMTWLNNLRACPSCGYQPTLPAEAERAKAVQTPDVARGRTRG
jgi:hypothetical protein